MEDGDFQALYSILSWIKAVEDFLTKKVNIFENVRVDIVYPSRRYQTYENE